MDFENVVVVVNTENGSHGCVQHNACTPNQEGLAKYGWMLAAIRGAGQSLEETHECTLAYEESYCAARCHSLTWRVMAW